MTEKIVDEKLVQVPPKVTVGFSRKISPKQYENAEASVYIEVPLDSLDPNVPNIEFAAREVFQTAKAIVFDQLGVEYDVDPVTNAVVENLQRSAGAKVVEERPVTVKSVRKAPAERADKSKGAPVDRTELWNALEEDLKKGHDEKGHYPRFWDNTETKTGNQPDFRAKVDIGSFKKGDGLWLNTAPEGFPV